MFKVLNSEDLLRRISTGLLFATAAIVGAAAAAGMTPQQWLGAMTASVGSFSLVLMVRYWPGKTETDAAETGNDR